MLLQRLASTGVTSGELHLFRERKWKVTWKGCGGVSENPREKDWDQRCHQSALAPKVSAEGTACGLYKNHI